MSQRAASARAAGALGARHAAAGFRVQGALAWLLAAALVSACTDRPAEPLASIEVREVLATLLDGPRTVLEEVEQHPVQVAVLAPGNRRHGASGARPVLELVPPAAVEIELPEITAAAGADLEFDFCVGVDASAFLSRSERRFHTAATPKAIVHFELDCDGVPLWHQPLEVDPRRPFDERVWTFVRVALEQRATSRLRVRTRLEGALESGPPRVGIGVLEIASVRRVPGQRATRDAPNLVLFVADTLRADALGCYGGDARLSPHLDALAARGLRFEQVHASAPWTQPSMASLLTGLAPHEHGLENESELVLPEALTSLAERAQAAGMSTLSVSANPLFGQGANFDQGFERMLEAPDEPAVRLLEPALEWLRTRGESRFLLNVHAFDVHNPYEPLREFHEAFAPHADPQLNREIARRMRVDGARFVLRPEEAEELHALYHAEVAQLDSAFGMLWRELERLGLERNTVVAFTSDHGEEFLEHGRLGHASQLHEESVRVPLLLCGPGVPRGEVREGLFEQRRLHDTLLRLLHLAPTSAADLVAGSANEFVNSSTRLGRAPDETEARSWFAQRSASELYLFAPATPELPAREHWYDLVRDPRARVDAASTEPGHAARARERLLESMPERALLPRTASDAASEAQAELLRAMGYLGE